MWEDAAAGGGSYARTNVPTPLASGIYNANNQLTQRGSTSYSYDANGNLSNDGVKTYSWGREITWYPSAGECRPAFNMIRSDDA